MKAVFEQLLCLFAAASDCSCQFYIDDEHLKQQVYAADAHICVLFYFRFGFNLLKTWEQ